MNINEAKNKIDFVKDKFLDIQRISSFINKEMFEDDETGNPFLKSYIEMGEAYPEENTKIHACWEEIQKNIPPGFAMDSNLIRHLSFNEARDWLDITKQDIPRELIKVEEYKRQLYLIEYLDSLHPGISRVTEIVLNGDLDAALKVVYSSLDSKIRSLLKISDKQSTTPYIAKAFKEGVLIPPNPNNLEGARNFMMGVIGYYRNWIVHNPLPQDRNRLEASLSLFALAHETFRLLDACSKHLIE